MSFSQAIARGPLSRRPPARSDRSSCNVRRHFRLGALRVSTQGQGEHDSPQCVSAEAIARHYDVPVSQVHRGAREGWLPVIKFGRYSRFDPAKVRAALEGRDDDA